MSGVKIFNESTRAAAASELNSKWVKNTNCECCGTRDWLVGADLVAAPRFEMGYELSGTTYPMLMVMCNNCGNTKFFNVTKIPSIDTVIASKFPRVNGGEK